MKKTYILCIANQKGGVGKTTTAVNVSVGLAQKGHKTLLIDLDAQRNSSSIFLAEDQLSAHESVYQIFKERTQAKNLLHSTRISGLDLLPAHMRLAELESLLAGVVDGFFCLQDSLASLKKEESISLEQGRQCYDLIVIDCPPNLGLLTVNAFVCSDYLIIPLQAAKFSLDGLVSILETHRTIQKRFHPELVILGSLLTMYKARTSISKAIIQPIQQYVPLFASRISASVALEEAHLFCKSIFEYKAHSKAAKEYKQFTEELLDEIQKR